MLRARIAVFHAVVKVIVANSTERLIVKCGQAQALAQIIVKLVQCLQVRRERRHFLVLPWRSGDSQAQ